MGKPSLIKIEDEEDDFDSSIPVSGIIKQV
jgi:hypothetical protein